MSTDNGDIHRRLEALGAALGDSRLPGPDAARRRARQRSRRQAGGAVLGAVAAVAVGAIAIGGLPTLDVAPVPPAETPTGEPTTEPPAGDSLLLTVDDLEASSGADVPVGWTAAEAPAAPSIACAPSADDAADLLLRRSFTTPDDGLLDQFIETWTAEEAQARFNDIITEVVDCVEERNADNPDDNWMNVIWTVDGIGDDTWQADFAVEPRVGEQLTIVTITVIRTGDAITVLTQAGLGMHGHEVGPLPYEVAGVAATRLCAPAGDQCVTDPAPSRIYPPLESGDDEPGWLTVNDIASAAPFFGGVSTAGEVMGAEGIHTCFDDPLAAGAESFVLRSYTDPNDTSAELALYQYVATFGSNEQAEAYYAGVPKTNADCAVEVIAEANGTGYEGTAWISSDEFVTFHLGAVINGSAVSFILTTEPPGATGDITPEQMQALLERVGVRLADLQ